MTRWTFLALLVLCVMGCDETLYGNAPMERKMSTIKFFATGSAVLPASPGSVNSVLTVTWDAINMGVESPFFLLPSATPLAYGRSPDTGILISRYRFRFLGAPGLRVGRPSTPHPLSYVSVTISGHPSSIIFPWTGSDDWEPFEIYVPAGSAQPSPVVGAVDITADTRLMDSVYYGTVINMIFELEASCVVNAP